MKTISVDEFKKKYGESGFQQIQQKQGFVAETGQDFMQMGRGILNTAKDTFQKQTQVFSSDQPLASKLTQSIGIGAGGASGIFGEAIKGGVKMALPQEQEQQLKEGVQSAVAPIVQSQPVQNLIKKYESLDENTKRDVDSLLGIGSFVADITGLGIAGKGAKVTGEVLEQGVKKTAQGFDVAKGVVGKGAQQVGETLSSVPGVQSIAQMPSRIGTNLAERQATEKAIKSLPTQEAKTAVRQGVDLTDVQKVVNVPKDQKEPLRRLFEITKRYVADPKKTNPIEAVGKPIVKRLNTLKQQTEVIGKKLDSAVKNLKFQDVKQIEQLGQKIDSGLQELGVTFKGGKLNLKGSQLEGLGGNETIIQNVYKRFVNSKDAQDLHRLKKYIDDNVTFGKTAQGLTGSAERLLKNWRKSIDTTLDNQFPAYKKLNNEYKARISPISDMQKLMKSVTGADEDILNMSAGLLAKRISSNAVSNPQIRQILRNLDKATKVKGKTSLDIENLVDFYGTLEKYFPEIVGKQTFQGQITTGIENVKGIKDIIGEEVKGLVGQTDAVRRKAILDLLEKTFK